MKDIRILLLAGALGAIVFSEAGSLPDGELTFPYEEAAPDGPVPDFPYDSGMIAAVQEKPAVVEKKAFKTPATLAKPKAAPVQEKPKSELKSKNVSLATAKKSKTMLTNVTVKDQKSATAKKNESSIPKRQPSKAKNVSLALKVNKTLPWVTAKPSMKVPQPLGAKAVHMVAEAAAAKATLGAPGPAPGGAPGPAPVDKHTLAARASAAEAQKHLESAKHAFDVTKKSAEKIYDTIPKINSAAGDVVHLYKPPAPAPTPAPKPTPAPPKAAPKAGAVAQMPSALAALAVFAAVVRQ